MPHTVAAVALTVILIVRVAARGPNWQTPMATRD
jgi:hypothetical protein